MTTAADKRHLGKQAEDRRAFLNRAAKATLAAPAVAVLLNAPKSMAAANCYQGNNTGNKFCN